MPRYAIWMLAIAMTVVVWLADGPVRAAEEWGLAGEKVGRVEAKVGDVLGELTGDCPAQCGGGDRQLARQPLARQMGQGEQRRAQQRGGPALVPQRPGDQADHC